MSRISKLLSIHISTFSAKRPFDEININLIEEYKPTKGGHMFSLAATDQLPLPDETAGYGASAP